MERNDKKAEKRAPVVSFWKMDEYLSGSMEEDRIRQMEHAAAEDSALKNYITRTREEKLTLSYQRLRQKIQLDEAEKAQAGISSWVTRLSGLLRPTRNRPGLVLAPALCLILVVGMFTLSPDWLSSDAVSGKGVQGIRLFLGDRQLRPDKVIQASPGDTLSLSYRGLKPLFFQVWYRDDGNGLYCYLERTGQAIPLEPDVAWKALPKKIVLDSHWNQETLYLAFSEKDFSSASAKAKILGGRKDGEPRVTIYNLRNAKNLK